MPRNQIYAQAHCALRVTLLSLRRITRSQETNERHTCHSVNVLFNVSIILFLYILAIVDGAHNTFSN